MISIDKKLIRYLMNKSQKIRVRSLQLIKKGNVGHIGATLSSADIVSVLYFYFLKIDPKNPQWAERDRLVLSKGHGVPPFYVALSMRGFFRWEELYSTYGHTGSRFQGHPDMRKTPGIEISAGSLGQGLSVAVGMALAARYDGKQHQVFCFMGDGECDEGQIWEAAMAASHYKLNNLIGIIDRNKVQAKGFTSEIMELEPFAEKWRAFGWKVIEVDGHNIEALINALNESVDLSSKNGPTVIIACTIKGCGVSFMENNSDWHAHIPNDEDFKKAIKELQCDNTGGLL